MLHSELNRLANVIISLFLFLSLLFLLSLCSYLLLKIFGFNKARKVLKHMNVVSSRNTLYMQLIVPYNGHLTSGRTVHTEQRIKTL